MIDAFLLSIYQFKAIENDTKGNGSIDINNL